MARKTRKKSMADSLEQEDELNVDVLSETVKRIHGKGKSLPLQELPQQAAVLKRFTFDIEEAMHTAFKMHVINKKSTMRERLIQLIEKDLNGEID